jgi:predicted Co/Zn/Cd cation transporter (cation efflux family)
MTQGTILNKIEKRSLRFGQGANFLMAIAGIVAAFVSGADAPLLDGLYSGIGLISTLIAAKVGESVMRPSDPNRPFGYYADEAIYITFRAIFILGMIVFAGFSACSKIFDFLRGDPLPALNFGSLVIYGVTVTVLCSLVVLVHYLNWKKSGSQSDLLKIEMQSSMMDTALSAGIVVAFASAPLLAQTPARGLLPIVDAIIVLVLIMSIIKQPLKTFGDALGEIAGKGAEPKLIQAIEAELQQLKTLQDCQIMDVALTKLGRFHLGVVYLCPLHPLSAITVDQLREEIMNVCRPLVGLIELEIVLTNQPRLINR